MNLRLAPKLVALYMIKLYQKTISFDHGMVKALYPNGYCKFYPTCSEYAVQAIEQKGLLKGSWFIAKRLTRCHPWSEGGIDHIH